jgi:ankyrin repeat protein
MLLLLHERANIDAQGTRVCVCVCISSPLVYRAPDVNGSTPLHLCCLHSHPRALKVCCRGALL